MGMGGASSLDYSSGINVSLLKFHVMSELCEAAGGPCRYTGTPDEANYGHLQITNDRWNSAIDGLRSDLDEHGVTGPDRDKLVSAVTTLKSRIVTTGTTR